MFKKTSTSLLLALTLSLPFSLQAAEAPKTTISAHAANSAAYNTACNDEHEREL